MTSTDTLQFFDLSHPWGHGVPNWPYFEDVKIERVHYHAKSRVLTQRITTVMHCTTHLDAPGHVIEGAPLIEDLPLSLFFGTGVVVSIPKGKWEKIMPEDLEAARPEILPGDIVIVNTGWHHTFGDNSTYYAYSPGFYREAGEWFVERGVKAVGTDTQALDHPLATAIAPHGPGAPDGLLPWACRANRRRHLGQRRCLEKLGRFAVRCQIWPPSAGIPQALARCLGRGTRGRHRRASAAHS